MTENQKTFCEEYVKCYNKAKAYHIAYPNASIENCRKAAYHLFKKQDVQDYIKLLQEEAIREFGNISDLIAKELLDDITYRDEDGNHSSGWQKSVDLLSKNLGLQKQDISVKTTTITVDIDE